MVYTIQIVAENKPGVLYRLTGLLTKRKINIKTLHASETKNASESHITLIADIDNSIIETLVKQMDRIVEIVTITYHL